MYAKSTSRICAFAIALFVLMTTWKRGRQILMERLDETALPLPLFISSIRSQPPHRVQGTAVFLTARPDAVPHALLHNMLHNQVLHEQVVLLTERPLATKCHFVFGNGSFTLR